MPRHRILVAENNDEFAASIVEYLEEKGFEVIKASNEHEARTQLMKSDALDLAILDIRLKDDNDDQDTSGLNLAKAYAHNLPKIMLTGFPSVEMTREALAPQLKGLPPAVDFIAKREGPHALLQAVRNALAIGSQLSASTRKITVRIDSDYQAARAQATLNYWVSLISSIAGIIFLFVSISWALLGKYDVAIPGIIAGVIAETIGLLSFSRVDRANTRMDIYHHELLETQQFENLFTACRDLNAENSELYRGKVIEYAARRWFTSSNNDPLKLDKGDGNG